MVLLNNYFVFVTLIFVVIFFVIILLFKFHRNSKINNKMYLERLVKSRTTELNENNEKLLEHTRRLNSINSQLEEQNRIIQEQSLEIKNQHEKMTELLAMKDKIFFIVAHDIRNPLSNLIGFAELIEKNYLEYTDEKILKFINHIKKSGRNIGELLENLLQWSRSQQSIVSFHPENINLGEFISKYLHIQNEMAVSKNIILNYDIDKSISVFADKNLTFTVFRNLLTNAIKFSYPEGSVFISAAKSDNMVQFTIQDQGIGMEEHTILKLFKMDNTISKEGTKGEKGTGLGLILCKDFVEKQGGRIWVESQPGKGSIFYFTLPVSR